ncbi:MAG TPA: chemotaxis response regulator protein-glutamate methylesterase [bacterium]|nr:chemotaxis response regulator protein-glutamate methylesterase [bacterium]HPN29323.1 chemotaxis response regulator protein-glutamate methylesterase [bacterium]
MKKVKVLIVDDSAVVRSILSSNLRKFEDIEVVGTASNPYEARNMIVELKPDVITLDIEMPRMNGLEFISVLMKSYPLPIIVISSLVSGKCETSLHALELGAVDIFAKPANDISGAFPLIIEELHQKIIYASFAKVGNSILEKPKNEKNIEVLSNIKSSEKVIAIGASTGGTEALKRVLEKLPQNMPPVIITQHMPAGFTKSFADRLNNICKNIEVREAVDSEKLHSGLALVAPGNFHLLLARDGAKFKVIVKDGPKICHQRPAVDVMFLSTAEIAGKNAVGVILTGMGSDGANGLLAMKKKGAVTISQSERTCVVYGMPREAYLKGAVDFVADLDDIPGKIIQALNN